MRFLGNRSSGRQGIALAHAALARGANVHLVAANVHITVPESPALRVTRVETALELRDVVLESALEADVVIMAAAVADFRPIQVETDKIKKAAGWGPAPIELIENPDILAELAADRLRPGQVIVGFAAETGDADGDVLAHGRAKARRKGADLLVINDVSGGCGFGSDVNEVTIVDADGETRGHAAGTKSDVSGAILDQVRDLLDSQHS